MTGLRTLLALLPDPDEPLTVDFSELDAACDRFDAEWKRVFGECPKPRDPLSDDAIDPNDTARNPPRDTDE